MEEIKSPTGVTSTVSIIYILINMGFVLAALSESAINSVTLNAKDDVWLPTIIILISLGIMRQTRWGRWFGYLISFPLIFVLPLGTLLGGYMIWHLTKYRLSFVKWL